MFERGFIRGDPRGRGPGLRVGGGAQGKGQPGRMGPGGVELMGGSEQVSFLKFTQFAGMRGSGT